MLQEGVGVRIVVSLAARDCRGEEVMYSIDGRRGQTS